MPQKKIFPLIIFTALFCFRLFSQSNPQTEESVPNNEEKIPATSAGMTEPSQNGIAVPSQDDDNDRHSELDSESLQNTQTSQIQTLPKIVTYVDFPVVEQRQVYTKDEIAKMNAADLPSLFQAAGIQILSYGSYGLEQKPSIRGFTDETVRVVIDGICVNNPQYGTFDFTSLNPDDIEKIEIVRGGFTEGVSDEGAVGGAIYITTKKQSLGHNFSTNTLLKTYFNAEKFLDTISQSFSYNGQIAENSFLKASAKATSVQNEYIFKNFRGKPTLRKNSNVYDAHSNLGFSHFFGNGNSFSANDIFYAGYKNTPGTENSGSAGIQQDYDNNLNFSLDFPSIKNAAKATTILGWISTNRFYDDNKYSSNSTKSEHYINTINFSQSAELYKFDKFKQSAGFTLEGVFMDSTRDGNHNQFSGTFKETSKVFVSDVISFSVPLAIKFSGENFAFIPKAGVKFHFEYLDFLLNAYRMIQFPNFDDLYWNENGYHGNPDLKPENGLGAEATINVRNKILPFSFAVFTNYYENKIQWANAKSTNGNTTWSPQNVASAFYLGFDFSAEQTFFKIWKIRANAEYLYTRILDKSEAKKTEYGKRIMWTPDLVFSIITSLDFSFATFTAEINYTGKKYTSNVNTVFVEPYCLVNLSGELKTLRFRHAQPSHFSPYFRLDNIFNVDYEAVPDYPMPGISLSIGVKSKF